MKKILVITPRFPYPVIGGDRLRIYEICKELSKYYSLTLVSLCESKDEMDYVIPDDGVFSDVHRCYHSRLKSYLSTLMALPTKTPLQVAYYSSPKFKRMVDELIPSHDLLLPHLIRVAGYVSNSSKPKILEMTDAISMNYARVAKIKNNAGLKGLIYCIEQSRLNSYEKKIAKSFNHTVLVSQHDKDYLFKDNPALYERSLVCSNGVDISKLPFGYTPVSKKLVFIGNMLSAQNFDAAYWFATSVLPLLRRQAPFTFHVIGRIAIDKSRKLTELDGVHVTGAVDNVADYAKGSLAGICSVRLAAGVQNKILEYMALGIPAVTTSTGLEGLYAADGDSILVANSAEEFVAKILRLHDDHSFSQRIAYNGFDYIKSQHSWSVKLEPFTRLVNRLIQ